MMKFCPRCRSEDIHETMEIWKPEGYKAVQCGKCYYTVWIDEHGHVIVPTLKGKDLINRNLERFPVTVNPYEAGILTYLISQQHEGVKHDLTCFFEELLKVHRTIQEKYGVKITELPDGMIQIVDKDGNVIIRPKHPWED